MGTVEVLQYSRLKTSKRGGRDSALLSNLAPPPPLPPPSTLSLTTLKSTLDIVQISKRKIHAQISALHVETLRLRASEIALGSQLKKEREKSQRILTDAEPVVRFHPSYTSLFFTPNVVLVSIPFLVGLSQRWPCVCCLRCSGQTHSSPNFLSPRLLSPVIGYQRNSYAGASLMAIVMPC